MSKTINPDFTQDEIKFLFAVLENYGEGAELDTTDIKKLHTEVGGEYPFKFVKEPYLNKATGLVTFPSPYIIPTQIIENEKILEPVEDETDIVNVDIEYVPGSLIPRPMPGYVPFGFYPDLKQILSSRLFFPVFITGWSGNGKTTMVEHTCSVLNRELILVNISVETDTTDLIGGFEIENGNTVYKDGPVLIAMKRGAILLLDEVDRGSEKLMCIQTIMEGKPYFNKLTRELITPAPGFNIVATANTKGRGSDDGRYLSKILDDAFLERFAITVEQDFPAPAIERRILEKAMSLYCEKDKHDDDFIQYLIEWATKIRATANTGAINEIISTRRLVLIIRAFSMFDDKLKSIKFCISRFDTDTQKSFMEFYSLIDDQTGLKKRMGNTYKAAMAAADDKNNPFV